MRANCRQRRLLQPLRASVRVRRRSLPPSVPVPVLESLHERWRERPRCPGRRVTPARRDGVVHAIGGRAAGPCLSAEIIADERAARVHRSSTRVEEENCRTNRTEVDAHHRALHGGAVLGGVNALRFASTRPTAGPSGIDAACARHGFAMARWWPERWRTAKRFDLLLTGARARRSVKTSSVAISVTASATPSRHADQLPPHRSESMRPSIHTPSVGFRPQTLSRCVGHTIDSELTSYRPGVVREHTSDDSRLTRARRAS
jgi:hypothetical protein